MAGIEGVYREWYTTDMQTLNFVVWSPEQIMFFRRVVLQQNTRAFAHHWIHEASGVPLSFRTIESWEQGLRRPSYWIRAQMSSDWRKLERKHIHLRGMLPENPVDAEA